METDFYKALQNRGLLNMLQRVPYSIPQYHNFSRVAAMLDEIRKNPQRRILVYGDYDVDGLMFTLVTKSFLDCAECTNYVIFPYWKRTHELDREAVRFCIQEKFDYMIIGDTASSDLVSLRELVNYGAKVLVLDHHVCDTSYDEYPENVAVISTHIENRIADSTIYAYSAGALAYTVYDAYAVKHEIPYPEAISSYALISLYSDCMDMTNEHNRAIYYRAITVDREDLPKFILHFMNEYQAFNARFIGYWYAPRINALFRGENFELLNKYFFDSTLDAVQRSECIAQINEYYMQCRKLTKQLVDLVDVQELDHFVFIY